MESAVVVVDVINFATLTGLLPDTAKYMIAENGTIKHLAQDGTRLVQQVLVLVLCVSDLLEEDLVVDLDRLLFLPSCMVPISTLIFFALGGSVLAGAEKLGLPNML